MFRIARFGESIGIAAEKPDKPQSDQRLAQNSAELTQAVTEMETLRRELCENLDKRARRVLPFVPVAVFGIFVVSDGWMAPLVQLPWFGLVTLIGSVVSWLLIQYRPAKIYRQTMRALMGRSIAIALGGFTHDPEPIISKAKLRAWPLFPYVSNVEGVDMFNGQRGGHDVTICRLDVNYNYKVQQRRVSHWKSNLHAICIKLEASPLGAISAVLLPGMIDNRLHRAVRKDHGLGVNPPLPGFEKTFLPFLATELDGTSLQERLNLDVLRALGEHDRVVLLFHQGQTIALFPLSSDVFVPFAPPPYWQKINPEAMLVTMSHDLQRLECRLQAVIALQQRDI